MDEWMDGWNDRPRDQQKVRVRDGSLVACWLYFHSGQSTSSNYVKRLICRPAGRPRIGAL